MENRTRNVMLCIAICAAGNAYGQTYYGFGAGMMGQGGAYFGQYAGANNLGLNCTFIGEAAGKFSLGDENTFVGFGTGGANNGAYNTMVGNGAGSQNIGDKNTFIGFSAGVGNQSEYNTIIGYSAGTSSNAGGFNTIIGAGSGQFNNGTGNLFAGVVSGFKMFNGDYNVLLGYHAAENAVGGSNNVCIGSEVARNGGATSNNVAIGKAAGFKNLGNDNTFLGTEAGHENGIGGQNTFLGFNAGFQNVDGQKNTYIGTNADGNPNLVNATAIGADTKVKASNSLILGNNANVGIGTAAPTYQLQLSTSKAAKLGSPDWTVISDVRLKKDVSDFTDGLSILKQIRPVWFRYNGKADLRSDDKFVGIIAQEMQKIAPYTIGTFMHQDSLGNKTEYLDYDANAVTYILINSVKDQQRVIEEKEARITALEKNQQDLIARLEMLEQNRTPSAAGLRKADVPSNMPVLEQNAPNGFSNKTSIKYFIPQSVKEATINVYTVTGTKVNSYSVNERGEGKLMISASGFDNGVFLYDLVTDGKSNGVKKMVVQK